MNKKKSYNKKKYLLTGGITDYTNEEKHKFKIDTEGLFSLTSAKIAESITSDIINLFPTNYKITITDATASVGGNTIPFLLKNNFKHVNIIEKDTERFNMLQSNIDINLNKILGTYTLFNDSFLNLKGLENDVIFIDPPWGGPDYRRENKIKLFLDNINLYCIINELFGYSKTLKFIIIKVPKNFDLDDFKLKLDKNIYIEKTHSSSKLKKMNIYYLKQLKDI
tara:strand:+ start:2531 stop:3199 length:669 start_codon:yes stop_codon:yes gene_type:complete